jgi:hypothetical protein
MGCISVKPKISDDKTVMRVGATTENPVVSARNERIKKAVDEHQAKEKTLEEQEEAKIQRRVHERYKGQVLRFEEGNDVVKFNLKSFNPKDLRHGRIEGQHAGNHFTLGIRPVGFVLALAIILWSSHKRVEKNFMSADGKCWNTGPLNGYDLCQHIKDYLRKIGKLHLSLLEAILEGAVEELWCLQKHVGVADAFFSHVQGLSVAAMFETLEDRKK